MPAPGAAALLVIDMISLMDFPGAQRMSRPALAAARRIHALRRAFHARSWPVVFANDDFTHWRGDFREMVAMAAATEGVPRRVAALLEPDARDHHLLKPRHSAFLGTPLPVLLAKLGVRRLLLTGMALEGCVLATALDANARDYRVAVVRDAVAGLPELRAATLKVLSGSEAARIVTSQGAIRWAAAAGPRPNAR